QSVAPQTSERDRQCDVGQPSNESDDAWNPYLSCGQLHREQRQYGKVQGEVKHLSDQQDLERREFWPKPHRQHWGCETAERAHRKGDRDAEQSDGLAHHPCKSLVFAQSMLAQGYRGDSARNRSGKRTQEDRA